MKLPMVSDTKIVPSKTPNRMVLDLSEVVSAMYPYAPIKSTANPPKKDEINSNQRNSTTN